MSEQNTRRQFIKVASLLGATFLIKPADAEMPKMPKIPTKIGGGELKLVGDNDALVKALKYVHDGAAAPKGSRSDKPNIPAATQVCSSCRFYTGAGKIGSDEVGKCQLIPTGAVKAGGWCVSWAKK